MYSINVKYTLDVLKLLIKLEWGSQRLTDFMHFPMSGPKTFVLE